MLADLRKKIEFKEKKKINQGTDDKTWMYTIFYSEYNFLYFFAKSTFCEIDFMQLTFNLNLFENE